MWPFDYFRKRRHDRRYRAALAVLLGHYMFARLEPSERKRIDDDVTLNMRGNTGIVPSLFWKNATWPGFASERATAMARLGIQPATYDLEWSPILRTWPKEYFGQRDALILDFWPQEPPFWDSRAGFICGDFYVDDDATREAKDFLRKRGLDIPDTDP